MSQRTWHAAYVPYAAIPDHLACGWMVAIPNGKAHYSVYGVIMEWRCECAMARPPR